MRSPSRMQTVQIEVTNACVLNCSNCTRFVGHRTPYFMEYEYFKRAVDSMEGFPNMVGMMGGEPLMHPNFSLMCNYMSQKFPRYQLGLWSTFPTSHPKYARYGRLIAETFGSVFLNNHTRDDIYHAPVLMALGEVPGITQEQFYKVVDKCWVQNSWSASINPKGAFFCEVAAAQAMLWDGTEDSIKGWSIEKGWWKREVTEFKPQIDQYCTKCGCAVPFLRERNSKDERDDVSLGNLMRLEKVGSKKLKNDLVVIHSPSQFQYQSLRANGYPNQTYKEMEYRQGIATPYGITLRINQLGNCEPTWTPDILKKGEHARVEEQVAV